MADDRKPVEILKDEVWRQEAPPLVDRIPVATISINGTPIGCRRVEIKYKGHDRLAPDAGGKLED